MSYLLALEIVAQTGSICCRAADGHELEFIAFGHRRWGAELVPAIQRCFADFGKPRALAVAVGPGSFTGLRVAVIAARSLAWVEDLPLYAVDSCLARAAQAGPGCWWVWQVLKKDTTFRACWQIADQATCRERVEPHLDENPADTTQIPAEAVVIGDALGLKPDLKQHWAPGWRSGDSAGVNARGVADACRFLQPGSWEQVLPAYHQLSAPELQRRKRQA